MSMPGTAATRRTRSSSSRASAARDEAHAASSWCRTKRRSSWRCWPGTSRDRACSTPARRRAARRRRSPRRCPRRGRVVACDVRDRRMALLQSHGRRPPGRRTCRARAGGPAGAAAVSHDVRHGHRRRAVLGPRNAAPRSRHPLAPREESDLAGLADAQRGMLRHAADVVAPGGRLVYATCSSEPEENEEVVRWLPARMRSVFARRSGGPRARLDRSRHVVDAERPSANRAGSSRPRRLLRRRLRTRPATCSTDRQRLMALQNPRLERGQDCSCWCGALIGTYVLFAAASMRLALRAREVQVPDLTNRTGQRGHRALPADLRADDQGRRSAAPRSEDCRPDASSPRTRRPARRRGSSAASRSG